tara:strand:- start:140 stop:334 length:195 start_codon:yes stop_codon:yes gene_type:complete
MNKYAVPNDLVAELIELGVCKTEEDAREKVASGSAPDLIKEAKAKTIEEEQAVIGAFLSTGKEE